MNSTSVVKVNIYMRMCWLESMLSISTPALDSDTMVWRIIHSLVSGHEAIYTIS